MERQLSKLRDGNFNMRQDKPDYFIIGSPKSGNTWLMECFNYHPEISCYNELHIMTQFKYGLGNIMDKVNHITKEGHMTTFQEFKYYDPEFDSNDIYDMIAVAWRNIIKKDPKDAKFYGEKDPEYCSALEQVVQFYPNAKIVHVVRDPRDVAVSYYHHMKRENDFFEQYSLVKKTELSQTFKYERSKEAMMMDCLTNWKRDQTTIETMKKRFPDKFVTIRYEDFSTLELHRVFSFIGARTSKELCDAIMEATDIKTRPKAENTFFTHGKSGNWHKEDQDLIEYMHKVLGTWLETYKYK